MWFIFVFFFRLQGDVSDLDLTFSVDEDQMGKIVTHELHSGGRARPVTNDNKYVKFYFSHSFHKIQLSFY